MTSAYHTSPTRSRERSQKTTRAGRFPAIGLAMRWVAGVGALALTACAGAQYAGELGTIDNFKAGVVADEPRAALIARDLLSAGGNAADAAVGAYFAMSVTLPASAGLGGGGVCLVHDADKEVTEVFDFLPRASAAGIVALPGNVRGMAAVNARYGKLPWAQLVSPAESLAGNGTAASRALVADLAVSGERLREDPQLAAIFTRPDGSLLKETDNLRQVDLGAALAQIRARGVNELYGGILAQKLVESANAIGAPLTIEELRNYRVSVYAPLEQQLGDQTVYLAMPPAAGGVLTAQMLTALDSGDGADPLFVAKATQALMRDRATSIKPNGDPIQPADQLITEAHVSAALANAAAGSAPAPENPSAATVVAVDEDGLGVACAFTMNAPFGAARLAPGTGIILAPAPDEQGNGFSALSPLIVANKNNGNLYYLSAASGGAPGAIAQALMLDGVVRGKLGLEQAMQRVRVFADGSGAAYAEEAGGSGAVGALQAAGFQAQPSGPLGRVNAIFCPGDTPHNPDTCRLRNDYRGAGLTSVLSSD